MGGSMVYKEGVVLVAGVEQFLLASNTIYIHIFRVSFKGGEHSPPPPPPPLGSLSPPLGTGRFVNDNSSLM